MKKITTNTTQTFYNNIPREKKIKTSSYRNESFFEFKKPLKYWNYKFISIQHRLSISKVIPLQFLAFKFRYICSLLKILKLYSFPHEYTPTAKIIREYIADYR